jgi:hypothetical protein
MTENNPFEFKYAKEIRGQDLLIVTILVLASFLPPYVGWGPIDLMIYFYAFICFMLFFPLRSLYRSFTHLEAYSNGVLVYQFSKEKYFIDWTEIATVRGGLWHPSFVLSNPDRTKSVRIDTQYDKFGFLLDLIHHFRPDLWDPEEGSTFYKSPIFPAFGVISIIGAIIIGVITLLDGTLWLGIVFIVLGTAGGSLALYYFPLTITFYGEFLIIRSLFRKRTIHSLDISEVRLIHRGNLPVVFNAELSLVLKDKDVVNLANFNVGALLLYLFFVTWHNTASRPKLSRGKSELALYTPGQPLQNRYAALLPKYEVDQGDKNNPNP